MPTKRTKLPRRRRPGVITDAAVEAYRSLMKLEAMDLPNDDPRMMAWGEHAMLLYEINKALGIAPWDYCTPKSEDAWHALAEAADLDEELLRKLDEIDERHRDAARQSEEDYILNGPHWVGWKLEGALDRFEERWGYRPSPPPESVQ